MLRTGTTTNVLPSQHTSLHSQFVEQVFNTNPNYCCNLIYSCISYGCATLSGGALLTHRLISGCPHYRPLPSALFLPASAPPHQKLREPPAKVSTAPRGHPAAKNGCTNWARPTWASVQSDRSKITDHHDVRTLMGSVEAQRGCSRLLGSITNRIHQ